MPTLSVKKDEIVHLIEQLDKKTKSEIFEFLKPQVLSGRWKSLFNRIDKKTKKKPISKETINQEVECARKEMSFRSR